ncbi:MAG TPA: arylsulfatase [Steroidobacteraceae bacterium]|nr:arylsulfatase [Steroidobacteraceae bacterium]
MQRLIPLLTSTVLILATAALAETQPAPSAGSSAHVLPFPDFHYKGNIGRTIKDSDPPQFPQPVRPPKGAPNIVLILIDDAGYGQFGTFGGQVPTPALDRVAKDGLRYTRFHTTALCSPTRAALLTGRNHHSTGNGVITEAATGYDGYTGIIGKNVGTIAEVLRQYGYATAWFGKNHNTPDWETSQVGPFDRWPSGLGFDYFYGFMGGDMDQWQPTLYENHQLVPRSSNPNYILTVDLVDHAIDWLRQVRSISADKPYFLYMSTGATHAPHHVSPQYITKYKGKFDQGWDVYREETFVRQKQLGVVPQDAQLSKRPKELPAWNSLSADQKKLFAHMMEVFAAFTDQTDTEMGRLLEVVRALPDADNTLVFYEVGDNGASAEGGLVGLMNENSFFNNVPESLQDNLAKMDELGGPKHFNHFPAGWAWAMNTPFQWTKQIASHLGGVRNPLVISWPARIKDRGGVRSQFHHVIDIAPTIYEAVGIDFPDTLNGVAQKPIEGISMVYTFDSASAPDRRHTQYFEMFINRGIYHDGWWAASRVNIPWEGGAAAADPDTATWELYNLTDDFAQASDIAKKNPAKLRELQDLWWSEAARYDVLPLDGRKTERLNAELQGRPSQAGKRTSFTYYPGVLALPGGSAPNVLNKSFSISADVEAKGADTQGAIFSLGGSDGGYGIYVRDGKPIFVGNFLNRSITRVTSSSVLPAGSAKVRADFVYDGGGMGKGATLALYVDDQKVGEGRMTETQGITLGLGGTLDVGADTGTAVDEEYTPPFMFNGKILQVTVDLKP